MKVNFKRIPNNVMMAKKDMLIAAINDTAGNIHYLDTKIALLMTVTGLLITSVVTCRSYFIYCFKESKANLLWHSEYILFSILSMLLLTIFFIFALNCIIARHIKDSDVLKSVWFIDFDRYKSFKSYINNVHSLNSSEIIENLALELYKLNAINSKKLYAFKWAMRFLVGGCISLFAFTINVVIFYILQ